MGIFGTRPTKGISQKKRQSSGHRGSVEKSGHVKFHNESHSARKTTRHITRRRSF